MDYIARRYDKIERTIHFHFCYNAIIEVSPLYEKIESVYITVGEIVWA
jgi:hypothetical protein